MGRSNKIKRAPGPKTEGRASAQPPLKGRPAKTTKRGRRPALLPDDFDQERVEARSNALRALRDEQQDAYEGMQFADQVLIRIGRAASKRTARTVAASRPAVMARRPDLEKAIVDLNIGIAPSFFEGVDDPALPMAVALQWAARSILAGCLWSGAEEDSPALTEDDEAVEGRVFREELLTHTLVARGRSADVRSAEQSDKEEVEERLRKRAERAWSSFLDDIGAVDERLGAALRRVLDGYVPPGAEPIADLAEINARLEQIDVAGRPFTSKLARRLHFALLTVPLIGADLADALRKKVSARRPRRRRRSAVRSVRRAARSSTRRSPRRPP